MSYDDYLERQRAAYENVLEIPAHYAEIEIEDPDEGGIWWMRVECLGDYFDHFVVIQAQRDKEPAVKQFAELAELAKRLRTDIANEIERQWRDKAEHYDD